MWIDQAAPFSILSHMMTSSNGTIFRFTGPLCGEFTGPSEFPAQRPVTRSFDVFFDMRLNKRVNNREAGDLRRHRGHYDVNVMNTAFVPKSDIRLITYSRDITCTCRITIVGVINGIWYFVPTSIQVFIILISSLSKWQRSVFSFDKKVNILLLKSEHSGIIRTMPWLLMPRLITSPSHQQPWYWVWSATKNYYSSLRHLLLKNDRKCKYIFLSFVI